MAKELPFFSISPEAKITRIKKNVSMVIQDGQKFILKKKRKGLINYIDRFRYRNEIRIYEYLNSRKTKFLNVPSAYIEKKTDSLILSLINVNEQKEIEPNIFSLSYLELQYISPKRQLFLDLFVQVFLSFFYRICFVSLFTISRKVNLKTALNSILLFTKLNLKQKRLSSKYWVHGDLYKSNFFYNQKGCFFIIDFENMFWTRKWPLAEIIGKSFRFESGEVIYKPLLVHNYLKNLEKKGEIENLNIFIQYKFALLQHSIREIAQTNGDLKRNQYIKLLQMTLNKQEFEKWYSKYHF